MPVSAAALYVHQALVMNRERGHAYDIVSSGGQWVLSARDNRRSHGAVFNSRATRYVQNPLVTAEMRRLVPALVCVVAAFPASGETLSVCEVLQAPAK